MRRLDAERLLEVVDRLLGLALLLLDGAELEVDVGALLGLVLAEAGEHLLVVGERAGPVLQPEAHVGEAADRLLVGEIELVRRLVGLERLLVLAERRAAPCRACSGAVLLAALALAALLERASRRAARPSAHCSVVDVLVDERQRRVLVVGVALQRELVGLHGAVVLAEHLVAELAELDEELGALRAAPAVLICS